MIFFSKELLRIIIPVGIDRFELSTVLYLHTSQKKLHRSFYTKHRANFKFSFHLIYTFPPDRVLPTHRQDPSQSSEQ